MTGPSVQRIQKKHSTLGPCEAKGCGEPGIGFTDENVLLCEDCLFEWATGSQNEFENEEDDEY